MKAALAQFAAQIVQAKQKQQSEQAPPVLGAEDMSEATTYTSAYQSTPGNTWVESSTTPLNYQTSAAGAWHPITTALQADPGVSGGLESVGDWWQVHFAPLGAGGGVTLDAAGQDQSFVPEGTNAVDPEVDPSDPSRVIYKDAWAGADLEYTVTSSGLQEDIILDRASAPTTYQFGLPGANVGTPGSALAGQGTGLPSHWSWLTPAVSDHRGKFLSNAGQSLTAKAGGAEITVSPTWLASQPASAFPIDVDPSVQSPGMPPWNWAPGNPAGQTAAIFCENSGGYSGHPSGGPYTTCTLPSGQDGVKVGYDGTNDWQTEMAFYVPVDNSDTADVPSGTLWDPPGECTSSVVGTTSQSRYCSVIRWAQIGLGNSPSVSYTSPGAVNVFDGKANWEYSSAGPYVLATASSETDGSGNVTLRGHDWTPSAGPGSTNDNRFPCTSDSSRAITLGDDWQQWLCNGPNAVSGSAAQTYGGYLTLGASNTSGGLGAAASTALGPDAGGSGGYGPYETFSSADLFFDVSYAPLAPTYSSQYSTSGGDDEVLTVSPQESSDPDGDALEYDFTMRGSDESEVQSGWTTSTSWEFPVSPGVSYTWQTLVEDPDTIVIPNWTESFDGPGVTTQSAPVLVTTPGGYPIGTDVFGGTDPTTCGCDPTVGGGYEVSPGDGDLIESSTDLSVPGAGVPLSLSRTYDSGLAYQQESGSTAPGALGYGWSYNLGMTLTGSDGSTVTINQENGSEISFVPYEPGSAQSWCLSSYNYCPADARVLGTLEYNSGGGNDTWTFQRDASGQTTFWFNAAGQLTREIDAQGDYISSSSESPSSGACPSTASSCTVWTSSASGLAITLVFNSSGRLLSATDGSSAPSAGVAGTVIYCYYGQSCADGASGGSGEDLYSATLPGATSGGATTTYTYDPSGDYSPSGSNADFVDFITAEDIPDVGTVDNTYNSADQVIEQESPSGTVSLSYSGNYASYQTSDGGQTIVSTQAAGSSSASEVEYTYSSGALVAETTGYGTSSASTQYIDLNQSVLVPDVVQTPASTGETSPENTTDTYSSASPLAAADVTKSVDAMGNTTLYAYNSYNQAWCTVSPAEYLDGVTCPSSIPSSPPSPGDSDPNEGATINFYSSSDQLLATTDPLGRTTTYSYTSDVSGVPDGLQYCSVGPVAYAAGTTCPGYDATHVSGTTTSTFNSAGDMLTNTDAEGKTTAYTYGDADHPGLPTTTTGPDGEVTTDVYDAAGEVTSSTVSFGSYSATTLTAYNAAGQAYCTVAPQEVADGVTCPSSPPSVSDPPSGVTSDFYNSDGQLAQTTGPTGATTLYAYDDAGNQYCTVGPQAYANGVTCPSSPPTSTPSVPPSLGSDPDSGASLTYYNQQGQVAEVISPLGGVTTSAYDADGNLESETVYSDSSSAPAVTTAYTYNADNKVVSQTLGSGSSQPETSLSFYDPDGNVYCSVSAKAYASDGYSCPAWQATWAAAGQPGSSATSYSVGTLYAPSSGSPLADEVTTSFYDADAELLQQSGPDQATTVSVYDPDGNVVCGEDRADIDATLEADPADAYPYACPSTPATSPPASGSDPGYETTIFDLNDRVTSSTDAAGDTTSYTYDPDGNVLTTTGPSGQVTTNCYYWQTSTCASGAPAGGGDATDLYSSTRPPAQGEPDGAATTYTYMPGGATATKTTLAGTASYVYDAAGSVHSVSYSAPAAGYQATPNVSYTYNSAELEATMTDGTGTTTYTYYDDGSLHSSAFSPASGSGLSSGTTSYTYYTNGDEASLTYPQVPDGASSATVDYSYDATGAMSSATDWYGRTTSFAHDDDGNTTSVAYPNDTTVQSTYDLGDAETAVNAETGTPSDPGTSLLGIDYTLDNAEQVASETDTGAINAGVSYTYDSADRLGSVTPGTGSAETEAYDASGDPTTLADGATQSFNGAGQDLSTTAPDGSATTYGYNATGDRTSTDGTVRTAVPDQSDDIYTVAGTGTAGTSEGTGQATTSELEYPVATVSDSKGDLYILDQGNARVQEIAATTHTQWGISMTAGGTYTVAGSASGSYGSSGDGGAATSALFSQPAGMTIDAQGNLYIADLGNNRVQEVAATTHTQWGISMTAGDVYTVAGSATGSLGTSGDGGPATSALLGDPAAVALDSAGDLYIADYGNHRVQEVPASTGSQWGQSMTAGDMYTVAGSATGSAGTSGDGGPATSALLEYPDGITISPAGDLYIADWYNANVQEVPAASGTQWGQSMTAADIYTVAGSATGDWGAPSNNVPATDALLNGPIGMTLDAEGDLYIADDANNVVQEVAASNSTQWGQFMTAGNIYIVAGSSSGADGESGDGGPATSALLYGDQGVTLGAEGQMYIADSDNDVVRVVYPSTTENYQQSGDIYTAAGSGTSGSSTGTWLATTSQLNFPVSTASDSKGNLYIVDQNNDRLQEVAATTGTQWGQSMVAGDTYTVAGTSGDWGTSGDGGAAPSSLLGYPAGVATDAQGNVYVADLGNNRVQELAATTHTQWGISMTAGDVYTVAGSASGSSGTSGDGGPATSALLSLPAAVALDSAGNLYIVDYGNSRVQEVAATTHTQFGIPMTAGDIYTVAGSASGSSGTSGDGGAATSSLLEYPDGIAASPAGDLYIADGGNNRVQEVPVATGTQWGISMTAGDIYTVAGSASGSSGSSGDGGPATSSLLYGPGGLALDQAGDLYIADEYNDRVQEVAAASGTQWDISMTAGDVYTAAGSASSSWGASGDGGPATSALLSVPHGVSVNSTGELYISDSANNLVRLVPSAAAYSYNEADELTGASVAAGQLGYTYNGEGLLTGETTPEGTATYSWDSSSGVAQLLSDGVNDYLYGPDGTPIEQANISSGTVEYYVTDDQGSTRALLGASGGVDATFTYDAYGNITSGTGSVTTPLLYGGQYQDQATGLYYLRARWYDPTTDQFLSVDPDVAETGEPYAYAGDDPINDSDPNGDLAEPCGDQGALYTNARKKASNWITPYPDIAPAGSNSYQGLFPYEPDKDIVQFVEAAEAVCDETGTPCNVATSTAAGEGPPQCQVGFGIDLGTGPCTKAEFAMKAESDAEQVHQVITHLISAGNSVAASLPKKVVFTQSQLDSLADFAYNLGPNAFPNSDLHTYIVDGKTSPAQIKAGFDGWVNLSRRNAEAEMYSYGVYENYNMNPVLKSPS